MPLINCPECGHEVSNEAVACPNCGRPTAPPTPVIKRKVVVAEKPVDEGFPKWIIAPIVILALIVIFLLIAITRNNEDANNRTVNVNIDSQRRSTDTRESSRVQTSPNQVEVPSSSTTVNPPTSSSTTTAPDYPTSTTSVPPSSTGVTTTVPADRGLVVIDAKISTRGGSVQAVKNERFYLLDKSLEEILNEADLEPIEGNSLSDSFGLATMYPDRYGSFQRDALNAIKKHIKYSVTTGGDGKASLKDVKPDSYYLFGITKTRSGFAIWSSPVSIMGGENKLNLQPATLNEISGE